MQSKKSMQIITCLCHKGGVGKTTMAYHLAAFLADLNHRVVLVDADGQGHATIMTGLQKSPAFYDLVVRNRPWRELLEPVSSAAYPNATSGWLACVPGNAETSNADNLQSVRAVQKRFKELEQDVDYIIVDTSPSPSKVHAGIYIATDWIIYPTEAEMLAIDALKESLVYRNTSNDARFDLGISEIKIMGIVPNKYRVSTLEHRENYDAMRGHFGKLVWEPITQATVIPEASTYHVPVWLHDAKSNAADEMMGFCYRALEVLNGVTA